MDAYANFYNPLCQFIVKATQPLLSRIPGVTLEAQVPPRTARPKWPNNWVNKGVHDVRTKWRCHFRDSNPG